MTSTLKSALACLLLAFAAPCAMAAEPMPPAFVRLVEVAPGIRQDIRYATSFNFTGAPVPGYRRPQCILTSAAAQALIRVEARLKSGGYALKLFDCYRPAQAVRAFLAWVKAGGSDKFGAIFHPDLARDTLIAGGFIGVMSSHSRGSTVDVGLVAAADQPSPTPADGGRCDGAFDIRPRETTLDLGTSFDCFSARSAFADRQVGPEAVRNRAILQAAMKAEGFVGYSREWWHFTLAKEPFPKTGFDFPVE